MKRIAFSFVSLLLPALMWADGLFLNLNTDTVEAGYRYNIDRVFGYGNTHYTLFGSYLDNDNGLFKGGFEVSGSPEGAESVTFAAGVEGVFADSYAALPLFIQGGYTLPFDAPVPLTTLIARFDYAPSVLSFIDANGYKEYRFEADMRIIDNFHIYGGYRNIETEYDTRTLTFDDNWYGGIRFSF